ncbi:Alpha/Beta hydrolase protein [Leptodontidium sp. MPI-SDFR-AT-0119]|nr:Alpha/Beta hydrolase protein [Leptodontidium sp. MPI-SDFR-AT-0119]
MAAPSVHLSKSTQSRTQRDLFERRPSTVTPKRRRVLACKGPAGNPVDPGSCDIVVYYLHGGAYVSGHPGTFLLAALRITETAAECGISLSWFGLEYSLAPETKLPTQVEQAVTGYTYLLDQNIDTSKIAVLGDSAAAKTRRGDFLESPWIDLHCSKRASYETNKYMDYINLDTILKASKDLLGNRIGEDTAAFIDFTQPLSGGRSWKDIMPARVWLSAGSHELLLSEIEQFSRLLEKDGVNAQFEVEEGGVHCWQGMKDLWDVSKYLGTIESSLPEEWLMGTAVIGNALLSSVKST